MSSAIVFFSLKPSSFDALSAETKKAQAESQKAQQRAMAAERQLATLKPRVGMLEMERMEVKAQAARLVSGVREFHRHWDLDRKVAEAEEKARRGKAFDAAHKKMEESTPSVNRVGQLTDLSSFTKDPRDAARSPK